jgi:hypothetical protein
LHRRVREIAQTHGLEIWQVEQAAINQRIWLKADSSDRYKLSRKRTCFSAVSHFVELDGGAGPDSLYDEQALIEQVSKDLRSFLT